MAPKEKPTDVSSVAEESGDVDDLVSILIQSPNIIRVTGLYWENLGMNGFNQVVKYFITTYLLVSLSQNTGQAPET